MTLSTPPPRAHAARAEFRSIDILKLVVSIIEGPLNETPVGAGLALDQLEGKGYIKEWFPLHDKQELDHLYSQWMRWCGGAWDQPLSRIRGYFGGTTASPFLVLSAV